MKLRILFLPVLLFGLGQLHVPAQRKKPQTAKAKAVKHVELKVEDEPNLTIRLPLLKVSVAGFLNLNTDGTTGFYLKRVGGNVLMNNNESFVFYPASTIKVMEHLHAMRRVQNSSEFSLSTQIDVWGDSCSDDHSDETPEVVEDLEHSLRLMMKNSNNQRTNAIQERFTRSSINLMAHQVLGMSNNSKLNHKFGCNGPASNPANKLTLVDISKLYEQVVQGNVISGTSRQKFYELMKNETDSFFIEPLIDEEAQAIGLANSKKDQFKAAVRLARKSGGVPAGYDGFLYTSTAGYVSLPFAGVCSANGRASVSPRNFVFGVFINKATNITEGTLGTASSELFRTQIRDALKGWKNCATVVST